MMDRKTFSFLNQDEFKKFQLLYYNRTYKLDKVPITDDSLINAISKTIRDRIKSSDYRMPICFFIEAEEQDGTTWAIEYLRKQLSIRFNEFNCFGIPDINSPLSFPDDVQIIPEKTLIRHAIKYRLMPDYDKYFTIGRIIFSFVLALLSVLMFVLQEVFKKLIPNDTSDVFEIFISPYFYIFLLVGGLFTFLLKSRPKEKEEKKVAVEIFKSNIEDNSIRKSKNYKNCIEKLANRLTIQLPCFVFVETYENLDSFAQDIIEKFFDEECTTDGIMVWIIFQTNIKNVEKLTTKLKRFLNTETYSLLPFDYKEKELLISRYNLPSDNSNFKTIKEICTGKSNPEYLGNIKASIKQYVESNQLTKNTFNELDILYLISLNSKPFNLFYTVDYFISCFRSGSDRDLIRNIILSDFFGNSAFTKPKLLSRFKKIDNELNFLIEKSNRGFRIINGVDEAFISFTNEFELSSSKIGHLYWALYHGDMLQNHAIQLTWTRTIIYHLLKIDYAAIEKFESNPNFIKILINLFNYHLKAIDLSIRTCYTKEIYNLIQNCYLLLSYEHMDDSMTYKSNYLKKAWQSFSLTFDDRILEYIFKTIENCNIHASNEGNPLETLFLETIPCRYIKEGQINKNIFCINPVELKSSKAYSNYFRTLAAWFSISIFQTTSNRSGDLLLIESFKYSFAYLESQVYALERIQSGSEPEAREIDFRTLSLSIWSSSLSFKYNTGNDPLADRFFKHLIFIECVLLEIQKYDELIIESEEAIHSVTYYYKGLIFELATISISSILMPLNSLSTSLIKTGTINKVNEIIKLINSLVNIRLPFIEVLSDIYETEIFKKTEDLFAFSSMIWGRLGLSIINNQLAIRRLQFYFEFIQNQNDLLIKLSELNLPLNEKTFLGVFCNAVLSNGLKCRELKTSYFIKAARVLFERSFGKILLREFSLIIVNDLYDSEAYLDQFFCELLKDDYFEKWLYSVPDVKFSNECLIHLTHSLGKVSDRNLKLTLLNHIKNRTEIIYDYEYKQEAEKWYNLIDFKNKISSEINYKIENSLEFWNDKKDSWLYPAVLELCIRNGFYNDEIRNDSLMALENGLTNSNTNSYLQLAYTISFKLEGPLLDQPLKCLESHIKIWEDKLKIDYVILIYEFLSRFSSDDDTTIVHKLSELKQTKWLNNHLEVLPELLRKGSFYLLFREYFASLIHYGLPLDINHNELFNKLNFKPNDKFNHVYNWIKAGRLFPELIISNANEEVINTDFIQLGDFLLSDQLINDPNFDEDRKKLNTIVENQMNNVFALIRRMDLPKYFIEVLNEFIEKYFFTVPC